MNDVSNISEHVTTQYHGDMSCEITLNKKKGECVGTLKYQIFEVGYLSGPNLFAMQTQFQAICEMVDAGAMVRHGTIMTGYHNRAFGGDVLLVDGEVIGEWTADDEECCHFTSVDSIEVTLSAPSPWMLQDAIANWLKPGTD